MEIGAFLLADTATRLSIGKFVRSRLAISAVAVGVIAVAVVWQWSWLAAIGVAPLLLGVAPCAAMCALGLCMHRMGGRLSSSQRSPSANFPDRTINDGDVT